MDISRLSSDLKYVNQIGVTLNIEEKMKLDLSLLKLSETESFDQVVFWGKVNGLKLDYYVAVGLNFRGKFGFPTKKFFWAKSDNYEFDELPEINSGFNTQIDSFRNMFTGDHKFLLIPVENSGEDQGQIESDNEDNIRIRPKGFTELDRLSFVVRAIENDCSLVPVGAFKLTPTQELRVNDSFKGIPLADLQSLSSYQHFRAPQSEEKRKFIARGDALFKFDFLDPISVDLPKGSWSIQVDSSKTVATVRSLLWQGFVGYHRANSHIFGYAYIGNGIKNSDLSFLL